MKRNLLYVEKLKKRFGLTSVHLIFLMICVCSLSVSTGLQAQSQQRITLEMKKVTIEKVISRIAETTRYKFTYLKEDLPTAPPRDYKFRNFTIEQAMTNIVEGTNLQWTFRSGAVIITKKPAASAAPLIKEIKGVVLDKQDKPVEHVSVQIVGQYRGALTDKNGAFKIASVPADGKLDFSFLGYEKLVLPVKVDMGVVRLSASAIEMKQVSVVSNGIFERPAENFTGAATTFTGDELRSISPTSILTALKVMDASFQVPDDHINGSNPNMVPKVQLRGTNSIMQNDMKSEYGYISNPPLIIIDGFESTLETLFEMSPNLVEKITLLKDAAATAIYGAKSANGVLVVETVQPKAMEMQAFYSGTFGVNVPDLSSFNLMNAKEKLQIEVLGGYYKDRNYTENKRKQDLYNLVSHNIAKGVDTYWLSQPLRTAFTHGHNVRLSYGAKNVTLQAIINYNNDAGIMKGSHRDVLDGSVQVRYTTNDHKFSFQTSFGVSTSQGSESPYGDFAQYARLNPYWLPMDDLGRITKYVDTYPTDGNNALISSSHTPKIVNPLYNTTLNTVNSNSNLSLKQNFWLDWEIFKGLKLNTTFNYTWGSSNSDKFLPGSASQFFSVANFDQRGTYDQSAGKRMQYQLNATLNYGKTFGRHTIFAAGGMHLDQNKSNNLNVSVTGFPNDRLDDLLFGLGYTGTKPSGTFDMVRTAGFYGNASYSYANRYLADASYRSDGSSVFGKEKRFGSLWSVGAGWNIHNESFLSSWTFLSQLKARASYGFTGSVDFPSYASMTTYEYRTTGRYLDYVPAVIIGLGNPDLVWQRTKKFNAGFDLGLFNGRVSASFNYYHETTDDLIMSTKTAPSNGFDGYYDNLGKSLNKGYDMSLRVVILNNPKKELHWSLSTSFYHNENKLLEITDNLRAQNQDALKDQIESGATSPVLQYREGSSVSGLYAVQSLGIDESNGYELFRTKDGGQTYVWSQDDLVYMGDMQPKLNMTIYNNFQFKWIRINFGLNIRLGGVLYNTTLANKLENVDLQSNPNVDRRALNSRWQTPGVQADYKGLTDLEGFTRVDNGTHVTSRFVQKANSIELTGITLDPGVILERYLNKLVTGGVSKLNDKANSQLNNRFSVRFTMNNVFRITSLKREQGTSYPFNRSFLLTVSAKF